MSAKHSADREHYRGRRFEEFAGARLGALLRYATALTCDPHQADDIVGEVLVRVSVRWRRISGMEQPEAYVKRMVLNEFLSVACRGMSAFARIVEEIVIGPEPDTAWLPPR